jgi:ATP-dependent Clp protease adaptor protein ClpS
MANRHNLSSMIADLRNDRWPGRPAWRDLRVRFARVAGFLGMDRLAQAIRPSLAGDGPRMAGRPQNGTALATRTRTARKRPDLYRVLLLNDDYTPMEFVIHVLMRFFNKNEEEATLIMLHVHHHGVGECGTFTFEIAETKVTQVMDFARANQHPLQCVMEKK